MRALILSALLLTGCSYKSRPFLDCVEAAPAEITAFELECLKAITGRESAPAWGVHHCEKRAKETYCALVPGFDGPEAGLGDAGPCRLAVTPKQRAVCQRSDPQPAITIEKIR